MANADDEAAKKAAEKKAAEEAAAKKAAEEAAKKAAAEKKAKLEKRAFKAVHNIVLDGETHAPGATVEITRGEWETLSAPGSIEGAWDD